MRNNSTEYPIVGQKIRYTLPTKFHWFTHVIDDEKLLELGKEYTVKKIEIMSSCVYVELVEFPFYDKERELPFFNLWAFSW
jgi:hypothetical protein